MTSLVSRRILNELAIAKMVLNGEMPANSLPPMPGAKDEPDHRRLVALGIIDGLTGLLSDIAWLTEETDRTVYEWVRDPNPSMPPPDEELPQVFGFAAGRTA